MEDARNAWTEVAGKVESLGLKLKLHLEQETAADVEERVEGETASAFDELTGKVTDAFDAFGNATRDDGVVSDVREIADLIRDALVETFRVAGAEVSSLLEQIETYAEKAADSLGGSGETIETTAEAVTDAAEGDATASDTPASDA